MNFEPLLVAANSEDTDDKATVPVVQRRGRFKVTSESVDLEKVTGNSDITYPLFLKADHWTLIEVSFSGDFTSCAAKESQHAGW